MQHVTLKHEQISEYWRGRGISNEGNEIEDYTSGGVKVFTTIVSAGRAGKEWRQNQICKGVILYLRV